MRTAIEERRGVASVLTIALTRPAAQMLVLINSLIAALVSGSMTACTLGPAPGLATAVAAGAAAAASASSPAGGTLPSVGATTGAATAAPANVTPAPAPSAAPASAADAAAAATEIAAADSAARAFYAYFDRVRQMSPAELGREFVRLDPPGTPAAVLELALALGQTRNPNDTVRAQATLDPLLKSTDSQFAPWRPLARLLAARYNEQRRLEEQIASQAQQLREAQRRQEQLAQQLEALKAIERSLTNRPAAPAAGAPNGRLTTP